MMSGMPFYVKIAESGPIEDIALGKKAKNIILAEKGGWNIPDGIILTPEYLNFFGDFIAQYKIKNSLSNRFEEIFAKFCESEVKETAQNKIIAALTQVNYQYGKRYAVRSAANVEDGTEKSYAGQFDTYLNVQQEDLLFYVFKCYFSYWKEGHYSYSGTDKHQVGKPLHSVIVQEFIEADFSGVLFTCNPVTAEKQIIIEAIEGVGEQLVSGRKEPSFVFEVNDYKTLNPVICQKKNNGKSEINQSLIIELIAIAKSLEKLFVKSIDVEWAIKEGKIFILQIRPVTGIHRPKDIYAPYRNKYCRTIIEDLWSDKMTNISSSIVFTELSDIYTFKKIFTKLGLNHLAREKAVEVFNGYGYLNVHLVAQILELVPKSMRIRELLNSFPPPERVLASKIEAKKRKIARVVIRSVLLMNEPAAIPFLTRMVLKKHQKTAIKQLKVYETYPDNDLSFYLEELNRLIGLLGLLQDKNQWGYGYASIFIWFTHHFSVSYLGMDEKWLLDRLKNIPDNISSRIQSRLIEIASLCDDQIREEIIQKPEHAWLIMKTKFSSHPFYIELKEFIRTYKHRSSNRDFVNNRWDESPEILITHIASILSFNNTDHREKQVGQRLKSIKQFAFMPVLWILIKSTKKFIALREDLRYTLDICFYNIRKLLIAISEHKAFSGYELCKNWIFFLELKELRELLAEPNKLSLYCELLNHRKIDYFKNKDNAPPYYIKAENGNVIPYQEERIRANSALKTFKGIAASAGIVEGRARVILDEKDFHKLQPGEVLVAYNTDPGWTPLFLKAKAVLVEMGGILNHCSIIAREYEVPAIVGLTEITKLLKNNQLVRVNGGEGTVEVISPE